MGKTAFEISAFLGSTAYTGHSLTNGSAGWEIVIALALTLAGSCPLILRWADAFTCCGDAATPDAAPDTE